MSEQTIGFEAGPWTAYFLSCMCRWYAEENVSIDDFDLLTKNLSQNPQLENFLLISRYNGAGDKYVIIPSEIKNCPVYAIGKNAFRWTHDPKYPNGYKKSEDFIGEFETIKNFEIESLTLPETIVQIQRDAFSDLRKLSFIKLPNSLVYLGEWCFSDTNIVKIEIPPRVKIIPENAFFNCRKLSEVMLSNVERIKDGAFESCSSLKSITFPSSLKELSDNSFKNSGLEYVSFSEGIKQVNMRAFEFCDNLKTCYIPQSVNQIARSKDDVEDHVAFFVHQNSYAYSWATKKGYSVIPIGG